MKLEVLRNINRGIGCVGLEIYSRIEDPLCTALRPVQKEVKGQRGYCEWFHFCSKNRGG
jgi:hypothetical protein